MSLNVTQFGPSLAFAPASFLGRLARLMEPPPDAVAPGPPPTSGATTLTAAMLRTALLEMGATPGADNLQLAQAFAHLGLALTPSALADAHTALARAPGASPLSYALACSLGLPPTRAILRGLSTITGGIPPERAVPPEISEWLGLALEAGLPPESLAAQLNLMVNQRRQSLEHRLATADEQETAFHDARTMLLRLAHNAGDRQTRVGADTLAAHIEGQQLINQAAQRDQDPAQPAPLYFAMPLQLPAEQTMLELRLQCRDEADFADDVEDETYLKATIRVATARLGRVEADLAGMLSGRLTCRLCAETPATARLLGRHADKLTAALAALGWAVAPVTCIVRADWMPLWHGGEALAAPRARVDWRV